MDTEQIPAMENNEQPVVAPEPTFTSGTPSPEVKEKKFSKGGPVVMILVFVVIVLLCGLTYFVLKDRGINLLSGIVKDTTNEDTIAATDESKTADTECTTDTETPSCDMSVDNKGWSLFSVPEYGFSVEVPTYIISQTLESQNIPSRWTAWFNTDPIYSDGHPWEYLLENKLGTAELTFYPARIPEGWGCGFGCTREHIIDVNIYKNNGAQNLGNVVNTYRTDWEAKYVNEDVLSGNLKGENVKKWGADVWSFDASREGGTWHGYLVVTNDYIYEVKYMFSDGISSAESLNIAQKVLDSMKFGE